jgi:predicted membrane protein
VGALWIGGRAITSTEKWRGACWALFAGIVYGLGFYTYLAYRVTPLLLLLLWFHQKKANPPRTQIYFAGAIAAGLTILPLLLFVIQHPDIYFQRELFLNTQRSDQPILELLRTALTTISMLHFHGDLNPRQNLPGEPLLIWPVGLLFLVGIAPAWRQHRWLFSWVAVGLLPALLTSEGAPHSGRALLAAPPIYLIAASGADWISTRSCLLFRIIVGAVSISAIVAGYQLYFVTWAGDPRVANAHDVTLLNFSSKVNCMPIELPKYVILDPDPMTVAGLPVAAQTIMFLTDTATQDRQQAKNIHYLWPHQTNQIARGYVWVGHIEMTRP